MGLLESVLDVFDMAKDRKRSAPPADPQVAAAYLSRLTSPSLDREAFDVLVAEIVGDSRLRAGDVIAIAYTYNCGGRKPSSKAAALAMIRKRYVEIARTAAKNRVAQKARPW